MSIALKFTSLFIRTLAKPIATRIKTHARDHPTFRRRCISAAQAIHRAEATLRVRLLNESEKKIRPLNDARAIETGATFVAETFVFSVAASLIFYESWRSKRKEMKRHESVSDDIKVLQDEIIWIKEKLQQKLIIDRGEEIPLPKGLKPAVLKIIAENENNGSIETPQSSEEVSAPKGCKTLGRISRGAKNNTETKATEASPTLEASNKSESTIISPSEACAPSAPSAPKTK